LIGFYLSWTLHMYKQANHVPYHSTICLLDPYTASTFYAGYSSYRSSQLAFLVLVDCSPAL
jgi:hypothetical protein